MRRLFLAFSLFLATTISARSEWDQFRGPRGTGSADSQSLPDTWSATENVRWKAALPGRGLSNPIISGERVFVTASSGYLERRLHVLCMDLESGKKLWERQFAATGSSMCHPTTCMAAPTPTTDGQRVYALFATGDLVCLDWDGNLVWYRSLVGDYPNITNQVGMAASPVLCDDVLLVPMENAGDSFAAGLDKLTGKNLWRADRLRDINWATPLVITNGGRKEALFQTGKDTTAYDPRTGEIRWTLANGSAVASPIAADGVVYVPGGEFQAVRPRTDGATPEVVWKSGRIRTGYTSALAYRGRIYGVNQAGVLLCADVKDGNTVWQHRLQGGKYWASPVAADGKVFVVNEEGVTVVVDVSGKEPKTVAKNSIGETILATPALARGRLFLRSDQHLYCIAGK